MIGRFFQRRKLKKQLKELQLQFMPEDSKAGVIRRWLEEEAPEYVCGLMIWREALGELGQPKTHELKEIGEIIRHTPGWEAVSSHRFGKEYGTQRAYKNPGGGFHDIPAEAQEELPFNLG